MDRQSPPVFDETIRKNYAFFVNDDFKVTPRLTVNLGLRYEYHPYWNGILSVFDIKSGKIVVPDGYLSKVSPLYPKNFVDIVTAGQAGYASKTLLPTDKNNFAPRVGLAYRPWGNNTVIRTGFGIFYDNLVYKVDNAGSPYTVSEPSFTQPGQQSNRRSAAGVSARRQWSCQRESPDRHTQSDRHDPSQYLFQSEPLERPAVVEPVV